jgi:hypothetical protein
MTKGRVRVQVRAGQRAAAADAQAIEAAKQIVAQTPLNDNDKIVLSLQLDNAVLMDPGAGTCFACLHGVHVCAGTAPCLGVHAKNTVQQNRLGMFS